MRANCKPSTTGLGVRPFKHLGTGTAPSHFAGAENSTEPATLVQASLFAVTSSQLQVGISGLGTFTTVTFLQVDMHSQPASLRIVAEAGRHE